MNTKYMVVAVAAMAVMLIGATALAATDDAFADKKKKYGKSLATHKSMNVATVSCQQM